MQDVQPSLINRGDTLFGICQGAGEDLGIPPTLLRVAFAALLFWNWEAALALYAGLGLVVFASRWLFPATIKARPAAKAEALAEQADNDREAAELAVAA